MINKAMMFRTFCRAVLLVSVPLTIIGTAQADWELSNEESTLSFVTIKADNVAEIHTFDRIAGSLSEDGALEIVIDLISVNTLIPIRNERMQNMLFETGMFPQAKVTGNIDMTALENLAPGSTATLAAQINLNLHAQSNVMLAELMVTRLGDGFLASTRKPVIVNAEPFGLAQGVEALREIAGLSRISLAVPVNIVAVFKAQ